MDVMYCCKVALDHEVGHTDVVFYPTADAVPCKDSGCGVVCVSIGYMGTEIPQDWEKMRATSIPAAEMNQRLIQMTREAIAEKEEFLARLLKEEECRNSKSKSSP